MRKGIILKHRVLEDGEFGEIYNQTVINSQMKAQLDLQNMKKMKDTLCKFNKDKWHDVNNFNDGFTSVQASPFMSRLPL